MKLKNEVFWEVKCVQDVDGNDWSPPRVVETKCFSNYPNDESEKNVKNEDSNTSSEDKKDEPAELSDWEKRLEQKWDKLQSTNTSAKKTDAKKVPEEKAVKRKVSLVVRKSSIKFEGEKSFLYSYF